MNPKNVFRLLLIGALLVGTNAGGLATAFHGNIPAEWRTATEWDGNGASLVPLTVSGLPVHGIARAAVIGCVVLFLLSVYAGLFLFWRFARLANLLLTVLFLVIAPLTGLVVLLPFERALYDFTMLCEGAVIAVSYAPPIKGYFESR